MPGPIESTEHVNRDMEAGEVIISGMAFVKILTAMQGPSKTVTCKGCLGTCIIPLTWPHWLTHLI